jgi:hypothetical protein
MAGAMSLMGSLADITKNRAMSVYHRGSRHRLAEFARQFGEIIHEGCGSSCCHRRGVKLDVL